MVAAGLTQVDAQVWRHHPAHAKPPVVERRFAETLRNERPLRGRRPFESGAGAGGVGGMAHEVAPQVEVQLHAVAGMPGQRHQQRAAGGVQRAQGFALPVRLRHHAHAQPVVQWQGPFELWAGVSRPADVVFALVLQSQAEFDRADAATRLQVI